MGAEEGASCRASFLYDHYKDTVAQIKDSARQRGWYNVALIVVAGFSAVLGVRPELLPELADALLRNWLRLSSSPLDAGAADIVAWVATLYLFVRYIQLNVSVERGYGYISHLEHELCDEVGTDAFSREGDEYANRYPRILDLIDLIYKAVFPLAFWLTCVSHIVASVQLASSTFQLVLAVALFLLITILLTLYGHFLFQGLRRNSSSGKESGGAR